MLGATRDLAHVVVVQVGHLEEVLAHARHVELGLVHFAARLCAVRRDGAPEQIKMWLSWQSKSLTFICVSSCPSVSSVMPSSSSTIREPFSGGANG